MENTCIKLANTISTTFYRCLHFHCVLQSPGCSSTQVTSARARSIDSDLVTAQHIEVVLSDSHISKSVAVIW